PPEHHFGFHLRRHGGPGGDELHEPHFNEAKGGHSSSAVVDGHVHDCATSSSISAVSSGCPGYRSYILTEEVRRTISIIRRAGETFSIEAGIGCSRGKCSSEGWSGTRRGFGSNPFKRTTKSSVAVRGACCGSNASTGKRTESCQSIPLSATSRIRASTAADRI